MMKNFGKYDYVIQKYLNPGESPVTASEKGRIAKFSFGITFCPFVYKSAYSLFWQIAQQLC